MKKQTVELPKPEEFENLINLLSVYTEAANRISTIQNDANQQLLDVLDELKADYAEYQAKLTEAEAAMEAIALKHPEWFGDKKSIKTPYGTIKLTKTNKLDIPNEEATIILLEHMAEKIPGFNAANFIRQAKEIDREALEKLDDATLQQLRVKRVTDQSFSVKPASIDMGKAVKSSEQNEDRKAAA